MSPSRVGGNGGALAFAGALFADALAFAFAGAFAGGPCGGRFDCKLLGGGGAFDCRVANDSSLVGGGGAFDCRVANDSSLVGGGAFDCRVANDSALVGGGKAIGTSHELEAGSFAISLVMILALGGFCSLSKISISLLLNSFSLFLYFANSWCVSSCLFASCRNSA